MILSEVEGDINKKIAIEQNIIQGATNMKKKTDNVMVIQRCNTSIREARQNIEYLQETLSNLRISNNTPQENVNSELNNTQTSNSDLGGNEENQILSQDSMKGYGYLSTISPNEHMFSRLDLVKYDCPSLSQRIRYMLQQLEFKLQVEKQYQEANTKLTKLYQIDGDQRSSSAAEGSAFESKHRILMLKKALKKYRAINVDLEQYKHHDEGDMTNIAQPKYRRKALTGVLTFGIAAVRDVDHIQSPMFVRSPESFITIKIDDTVKAKSKPSRNDRWHDEFQIQVEKGNEIEITVYDKVNDMMTPVAIMWLQLADIVEEIRKKKATQTGQQGWVSASNLANTRGGAYSASENTDSNNESRVMSTATDITQNSDVAPSSSSTGAQITTNQWFMLEPAGQILLTLGFHKTTQQRKNIAGGLHRHGAIINRDEEVYEQHGHHFVQKSFYNIMSCAYCNEFLRYTGFQCQDCKFLCHKKCYTNIVTKCIAKTSTDQDTDEAKLNHNIPHRFEPVSNRGTKWCCHCGYILPWGKQKVRKCSECGIMCHTQCAHLVPDFCGMSMEMANQILRTIQDTQRIQEKKKRLPPPMLKSTSSGLSDQPFERRTEANKRTSAIFSDNHNALHFNDIDNNQPSSRMEELLKSATSSPQKRSTSEDRINDFINNNSAYLEFSNDNSNNSKRISIIEPSRTLDPTEDPSITVPFNYEDKTKNIREDFERKENYRDENDLWEEKRHQMALEVERQRQEQYEHSNREAQHKMEEHYNRQNPYITEQPAFLGTNVTEETSTYQGVNTSTENNNPFREMNKETFQQEQEQSISANNIPATAAMENIISKKSSMSPQKSQVSGKHKRKGGKRRKVSLDNFILLKVLGKGNFGKVILSKSKNTGRLCAIKVLKKDSIIQNHDIESARAEKKVFLLATKTKHPFLTNLYCSFQTENRIYFAMEFIGGGDLMWHVQNQRLSVRRAKFYAAEVLLALKYFHDNGVIYRDLKLENILLTPQGHIKIADYGLCKDEMWYGNKTSTFCGTPEFMAPEILKDQQYTRAVDWWAFGVLLYQMLLCQSPFSGDDEDEVFNAILTDEPLYPIDMAGDIVQIFQGLLTKDPNNRLGAGPRDALEVMEEPFFHNIDFNDILNLRVKPPYIPEIKSEEDTSYFEQEFTSAPPTLTPIPSVLKTSEQEEFRGFSFMPDDLEL